MQNKGLIKLFAILFGLVSLYQLSFTFFTSRVENDAKAYAKSIVTDNNGRELAKYERKYLDSVANEEILNLGFSKFTYNDIRNKEMNLGLDLKGGINAILQVSVKDILIGLAIVNPIYFICMMVGAMKTIQISLSVILGAILGPIFYFVSPEWCILFGGFIAGTIAYFFGEFKNGK